jgi:CarboxypepD_reg-like domain/TonB-dependent Receptor Plug Domain
LVISNYSYTLAVLDELTIRYKLKLHLLKFSLIIFIFAFFQMHSNAKAKIEGTIIDATTKKPIVGASIVISPGNKGTKTDENGKYSITLPFGEYFLTASAVGYYKKTRLVKFVDDLVLDLELAEEIKDFDEVIVKGRREDANIKDVEMGAIKLNMNNLRKIPVVFGESDIIKALTLQPGVTTVGEGAGGLNVRGGKVDQNLVTLDGVPLFNTSHLLGFFTSINADVVQDVTLYKGGVPASSGGRLSALLAMNTKVGNDEKVKYSVGVGTISSRLVVDGPIIKNKLNFVLAGRIAYPNVAIKNFPPPIGESRAFFYDFNGKLSFKLNEKNRFTLSGYRSFDDFKFPEDTAYSWNMTQANLQWNRVISNKLSLNTAVFMSNYDFDVIGLKAENEFLLNSAISHKEAKTALFYTPNVKIKGEFGANIIRYDVSPSDQKPNAPNSNIIYEKLATEKANEGAVFASGEYIFNEIFTLSAGLRYSFYQNLGPKTVYNYGSDQPRLAENITDSTIFANNQVIKSYGGLEPRISLKVGLGEQTSIKFSYNKMRQYLNLISNTTAISPIDYWKLADTYIPPQIADQYSMGIFRNSTDNMYEFAVEGYYKDLADLVDYKKGARLSKNPLLETSLLAAIGRAYGLETSIKKNKGDFTGIISYTYSRSLTKIVTPFPIEAVNGGRWFPANYDRPHNFTASVLHNLGYGFNLSGNFVYTSGRPATYPDGSYRFNGLPVINYSRRNIDRIPDYHRMDLSLSFDTRKVKEQKKYSIWVLSFYNLYARKNPYSIYFTSYNRITRSYRLSVFGSIIPSLTFNKNF